MIFTAVPVSAVAQTGEDNPLASIELEEGFTLFYDKYHENDSKTLTVKLIGENDGDVTDVDLTSESTFNWETRRPSVAAIALEGDSKDTVRVTAKGEGTALIVVKVYRSDGTYLEASCTVTVRKSIQVQLDSLEVIMSKLPSDIDKERGRYTEKSVNDVIAVFGRLGAFLGVEAKSESLLVWAQDILAAAENIEDTAENCATLEGFGDELFNVINELLKSVIAPDDDYDFWEKWESIYNDGRLDDYLLNKSAYIAESADEVNAVLDEYESGKPWLITQKTEIDELAERLDNALNALKKHTTKLEFKDEKLSVNYGTLPFHIEIKNKEGDDPVKWYSSDKNIADVDSNGWVTIVSAIPEGYKDDVVIFATSYNQTARCILTVNNPVSRLEKQISDSTSLTFPLSTKKDLPVKIYGADESCPVTGDPKLVYEYDKEGIVTVNDDGEIIPLAIGSCVITVSVEGYASIEPVTVSVKITAATKVNDLILQTSSQPHVTKGDVTEIRFLVLPRNATNKEIEWWSDDESIATVKGGVDESSSIAYATVTGITEGNTTIHYRAVDGNSSGNNSGSLYVTVDPRVSMIMFDRYEIEEYIGTTEEIKIDAFCQPVNAGNQVLTWSSSDEQVATVVDGVITLHKTGTCVITATTNDGEVSNSADLRVIGTSRKITMKNAPSVMETGDWVDLDCTVITEQDYEYEVKDWSVDKTELASIDSRGVLTVYRPGEIIVTAKAYDGKTAKCVIKIIAPLSDISLPSTLTLSVGSGKQFTPAFIPEYATNKNVTWKTSDSKVASITTTGYITAVGTGEAIITVRSEDGGYTATCKVKVIQPVSGISINKTSYTLTMGVKESIKLTETVSPSNATTKNVTWKSSKTSVATVSSTGTVTAKGPGTAKITVTTLDGGYTASCSITVIQPVKSIKFSSSSVTYYVGQEKALSVVFTPSNASNKNLKFTSSNTSVASVGSSSGKVTAKKTGSCEITAVSEDGSYKAKCTVKVVKKVDVEKVKITKSSVELNAGKTKQLKYEITPSNASDKSVSWSSSDKSIASVNSSGLVTAHKGGTVTIKCKSNDTGEYSKCKVTVIELPKSITLSTTSLTLDSGKSKTLTAEVNPSTTTNKDIKWYSTNSDVATVSSSGKIKAIQGGYCEIVAKSKADDSIKARCKLTVLQLPEKITLNENDLELIKGEKAALSATVKPSSSYYKNVKWKSSDSTVAKVSSSGVVTAISAGKAVITCSCEADQNIKTTCLVTVYQPVTGISLSTEKLTLTTGRTKTLVPTITPTKATNKKVTYRTSNRNVVKVNTKGRVEAVGPGQATVTVRTEDGAYTAKCVITVIEPVVSIKLNKKSTTMTVGKTKVLVPDISPSNATNKDVVWRSSNSLVARVTQGGKVTAMAEGTATITCTTEDGNFTATCKVTCIIPVDAVEITKASVTVKKGNTTKLKANIYPEYATNHEVKWKSSDKSIATVDSNGKVTALKKGTCTITCTSVQSGKKSTCKVTVK